MKKPICCNRWIKYIAAIVCSIGIAVCIVFLLLKTGIYWQGSALYAQLYKLDAVAESMQEGSLYPLYAEHWYNGYEIFRYSPPASYILINAIMLVFHTDIKIGICLFYGVLVFVSQMGFFLFGIRQRKMIAAFFTGIAFLLLPSTVNIVLLQGSFDVNMGLFLMPLLLFFLHDFIKWKHRWAVIPFSLLLGLLIVTNYILAIVFGIVILFYLILYGIAARSWRFEMTAFFDVLLVYVAMGYFLYPALSGGVLTRTYSLQGNQGAFTGISMLVIAVLGLITADRSRCAGFLLTVAALLLSFDFMEPVVKLIPSVVLQKIYWYLIVVVVIYLITLLCWQRLRLLFLILMLGVMVWENVPQILSLQDGSYAIAREEQKIEDYLLDEATFYTDNRVALVDATSLGAFPQWYFAAKDVDMMFGWDFENALTVQNQMQINEAFADGFYDYMFDRLRLYGNDVVVILKELLSEEGAYDVLLASAERNDYAVKAENDKAVVLKADSINGTYGVVTQYENLAIGDNASYIAYIYPSFGLGRSNVLEDYTIEELERYHKLYLSGFTYRNKEKAENMLRELSGKGIEIYIDMQHIPVNALTGKDEFMGVYAQFIQFTEEFPILQNDNGNEFKLDFKAGGYEMWNTVYISGCDLILKEATYDDKSHLTYLGQGKEPNITFMGFNLVYYYLSTHNQDLRRFLDEAMELSSEDLPKHEIVPIQIERYPQQLVVHTEADKVNSNLACVDTLEPDRIVSTEENLWVINQGDTVFRIIYTGQQEGFLLSILGMIGIGILWITAYVMLEGNIKSEL